MHITADISILNDVYTFFSLRFFTMLSALLPSMPCLWVICFWSTSNWATAQKDQDPRPKERGQDGGTTSKKEEKKEI